MSNDRHENLEHAAEALRELLKDPIPPDASVGSHEMVSLVRKAQAAEGVARRYMYGADVTDGSDIRFLNALMTLAVGAIDNLAEKSESNGIAVLNRLVEALSQTAPTPEEWAQMQQQFGDD